MASRTAQYIATINPRAAILLLRYMYDHQKTLEASGPAMADDDNQQWHWVNHHRVGRFWTAQKIRTMYSENFQGVQFHVHDF